MLRSDTTALFERLREANILLQEVLSGAHENMNAIEHTMVSRVSEFVAAMNDLDRQDGTATAAWKNISAPSTRLPKRCCTIWETSQRNSTPTGTRSPKRSRSWSRATAAPRNPYPPGTRPSSRWSRRSTRAPTISSSVCAASPACSTSRSVRDRARTGNRRYRRGDEQRQCAHDRAAARAVRTAADEQRKRTSEALNSIYEETAGQVDAMFSQSANASPSSFRA